MKRTTRTMLHLAAMLAALAAAPLFAQPALAIKALAEKKVTELPAGELYWRIENLPTLAAAQAAAGTWSLAAEAAGKTWLFTLGPRGGATTGATRVAEVGPIPRPESTHVLLRINDASGPPGAVSPVHSHPGSEAFFVLDGEQTIRQARGTLHVKPGESEPGRGPGEAMQVSSTGTADLHALVMFTVDADKPFSSPATLP